MKKYIGWIKFFIFIALCIGGVKFFLVKTATYPTVGQPVSGPVNQLEGFELSIDEPTWSPTKGYTIRYNIDIDSEDIYSLEIGNNPPLERLEVLVGDTWYMLNSSDLISSDFANTFDLGGPGSLGFCGSLVQKYNGYGTRLEPGTYRFAMYLSDGAGIYHLLAAEFEIA